MVVIRPACTYYARPAQVMELVDMLDLGSSAFVA